MIQYNNFLMKREQSRAGSRFAECEKSRLKAKILITLALLLTAVTGAWATETPLVTINASSDFTSGSKTFDNIVTVTLDNVYYNATDGWYCGGSPRPVEVSPVNGVTVTGYMLYFSDTAPIEFEGSSFTVALGGDMVLADDLYTQLGTVGITKIEVYGTIEPPLTVAWDASTKTGSFSMPGSDVVLTPQYAPAAQLDKDGAPAAVSGLEIAADAAIITAGQSAQGTLLYAVTTSDTEKPALTAFSATLPNAKDLTAAGTYYVWYYIQGHDTPQGQEPSADNTFNDSEIMGPVTVELLTNEHTLNIKQSPNITVTVAGTAKTPTDDKVTPVTTGQEVKIKAKEGYKFRKVEVKKKEAKLPKYADVVKICDMDADGKYLISSFFDGTNANFTTITKEEAIALAEYLGGGDIRVVFEEKESYGNRYARVTNAAGDTDGVTLSTTNTLSVPLYYVPAGN